MPPSPAPSRTRSALSRPARHSRKPRGRSGFSPLATASLLALAGGSAWAQADLEKVTITGTRIKSLAITSTSPVSQVSAEQIDLLRAASVEDFSSKLPQLAGGASTSAAGSNGDALGAQTLDLRNLGQDRTLVLINGTRAVPFSFRNAVDVDAIPATLIKRVDVLTGGAAAVYGADAVAGVVNFIMKDRFDGLQMQANQRLSRGGANQSTLNATGGLDLGDKGNAVGFIEYTDRSALRAGKRDWAMANSASTSPRGGNFTDVASGNKFSVDDAGRFTQTPQTANYTGDYLLVSPLQRLNGSTFFHYDATEKVELYGRYMFSKVKTSVAPTDGQDPIAVNDVFNIQQSNPFIPSSARPLLTFRNGVAQVNIERSLGELGVRTWDNDRTTQQWQIGARGAFTGHLNWDVYAQRGVSKEAVTANGDGVAANFNDSLVNSVNIFGPGADLSSVARTFNLGTRERTQSVFAGNINGDTGDLFKLPAGAVGFAAGVEQRRETGSFYTDPANSTSFDGPALIATPTPPRIKANEVFGELQVPLLAKLPFVDALTLEAAARRSYYTKSAGEDKSYDTHKLGLSWAVNPSVRFRATTQTTLREPNFGEFAGEVTSIKFSRLVTTPRLFPRYGGDPCVLGTGDPAQCARFGAPAVGSYDSKDPANLTGGYFFGGNPDVSPEKGLSKTLGVVLQPAGVPGLVVSVDYFKIQINDAIGQIQPIDALTSCYVTDPRADNPLCSATTRDPANGRILNGYPIDRNLGVIRQSGFDIDASYRTLAPFGLAGQRAVVQYQASIISSYVIQRNPVLASVDCKSTYGSRCSSDSVSLVMPGYKHRASLAWSWGDNTAQVGWTRVGKVHDSAVGSTGVIPAQDTFDLNVALNTPVKGLRVNAGIDNLFNKPPPTGMTNPGVFNTFTDTYASLGRSFGFSATYKF